MTPMQTNGSRVAWLVVLLGLAAGCAEKQPGRKPGGSEPAGEEEKAVRQKFAEVQAAIKAHDTDRLWGLLSGKCRAEAEKAAGAVRAAYEKAGAREKATQEKDLGLAGQELARLTGVGFLKTTRFRRKYDEVTDGAVTRVTTSGDSATVYFDEPDGDHEKMVFLREDGRWQAWLAMPKARNP
jgi:hypothetical protein